MDVISLSQSMCIYYLQERIKKIESRLKSIVQARISLQVSIIIESNVILIGVSYDRI